MENIFTQKKFSYHKKNTQSSKDEPLLGSKDEPLTLFEVNYNKICFKVVFKCLMFIYLVNRPKAQKRKWKINVFNRRKIFFLFFANLLFTHIFWANLICLGPFASVPEKV